MKVLCELQVAMLEQRIIFENNVGREVMDPAVRNIQDYSFRNLRDWQIYSEYINSLDITINILDKMIENQTIKD